GMARGLMAEPRFREIIERCETALAGRLERSLTDLLLADDAPLDRTDLLQPALFALEYAIAELWRSWGVEPVAVLGHSVGEVAAACFAGAMSLEEGLTFIAERGRLMATTAGQGGMAAAFASPAAVAKAIAGSGAVIAARNGPANTGVSGDTAALTRALAALEKAGIPYRRLDVATAFHSPILDPCLDALEQAAAAVVWRPARLPLASNVGGTLIHRFDAGYWRRQAREPVAFAEGLRALVERGCTVFLEVGPRPILSALGREIVEGAEFIAALRQDAEPRRALTEALARLYTAGVPVDWKAYWGPGWRRVEAPLYPFRRDRYASPVSIVAAQYTDDRPRLDSLRPDLPPALIDLVERLLARDAANRPVDASAAIEVLIALPEFSSGAHALAALMARLYPSEASVAAAPRHSIPPPALSMQPNPPVARPVSQRPTVLDAPVDPDGRASVRQVLELVAEEQSAPPRTIDASRGEHASSLTRAPRVPVWAYALGAAALMTAATVGVVGSRRLRNVPDVGTTAAAPVIVEPGAAAEQTRAVAPIESVPSAETPRVPLVAPPVVAERAGERGSRGRPGNHITRAE
ncbi:MAG: acyltransferase domain-containing protein, partial [Deltaproteobacteria bacterium]